mgnify:CR=1 FL=1
MSKKVIIALNATWNLVNFRANLIRAFIDHGYEVVAVAPKDKYIEQLLALGCRFVDLPMNSKGKNPFMDILLLFRFWSILRRERPAVFLGYTVKPNIYGSLAARSLGIPVINNIAGLGAVFIKKGWLTALVRFLYGLALKRSWKVFFQNKDDLAHFVEVGVVKKNAVDLLPGSGVDLGKFFLAPYPENTRPRFLLVARMLWDKGVGEFVEAAKIIQARGLSADFCLLGFLDAKNPTAISRAQMQNWVDDGFVQYLGSSDDVRSEIAVADCVVLPSYREGTPRSLLEAASMGRPIITTDAVGCREVVDDSINGLLCQVKDPIDLADKIQMMIEMPPGQRRILGERGRQKVEREFDEKIVIEKYLNAVDRASH